MGGVFMLTLQSPIKTYLSSLHPNQWQIHAATLARRIVSFVLFTSMLSLLGVQHICISFAVAAHPDTPKASMNMN